MTAPLPPAAFPAARRNLDVLLLQVREEQRPALHEELCFLERLGLEPSHLTCVNVAEDRVPEWSEAAAADLVLLGGAGVYSAHLDYGFTPRLAELVLRLVEESRPFFGSCFGHQFLARVLGGKVIADYEHEEVGTFEIELTAEGRSDPLFGQFPGRFDVHLGHHDRVEELPDGVVNLAASAAVWCQAIRVEGKPIYGTQFHCEMSADHMRERLLMYADDYLDEVDPLAVLEGRLRPTTHVDTLLGRFVETYF